MRNRSTIFFTFHNITKDIQDVFANKITSEVQQISINFDEKVIVKKWKNS